MSEETTVHDRIQEAILRVETLVKSGRTHAVSAIRMIADLESYAREFSDGEAVVGAALNAIEALLDALESDPRVS